MERTARIKTGISVLDRVLTELVRCAGIQVVVHCEGDRHIDDHHTAEDVAITLGQCLHEALGDKAGLARMGCAEGAHAAARCRAVLDLSNRAHFESDLSLDEEYVGGVDGEVVALAFGADGADVGGSESSSSPCDAICGGVLSSEMLHHVFLSLTMELRATVHLEVLEDSGAPGHTLDIALAASSAFGAALASASKLDPRRHGVVASSKGTLSQ